jgi:hypothetical protein
MADAVIIVPPPSPSDTNPPLGTALIASVAAQRGLAVDVLDLNIRYINQFRTRAPQSLGGVIGDHGKDKELLADAARTLFDTCGLNEEEPLFAPAAADPVAGMHYSFDSIGAAVKRTLAGIGPWRGWLERELLDYLRRSGVPSVFGVSIMGPSQVFVAVASLAMIKELRPDAVTVFGGSHITLLANEISRDPRYREYVDVFLPGHSEEAFVNLLLDQTGRAPTTNPNQARHSNEPSAKGFEYIPLFDASSLQDYPSENLTLPLQFTRGCAYGRCTFCTYPAVEPALTRLRADDARKAVEHLISLHSVRRFSLKDSLFTVPMLTEFADALLREPSVSPVAWSATTKASRSLIAAAPRLAASGLRTLELGVETIHPRGQRLFDKPAGLSMIEQLVATLVDNGISLVVNLIFGLPGETLADAERQLAWFKGLQRHAPAMVKGSLNLLEIVRSSPLATAPPPEVCLHGIAPWAYCYAWNSPAWRADFAAAIQDGEMH